MKYNWKKKKIIMNQLIFQKNFLFFSLLTIFTALYTIYSFYSSVEVKGVIGDLNYEKNENRPSLLCITTYGRLKSKVFHGLL